MKNDQWTKAPKGQEEPANHLLPRTRNGRTAVVTFLVLLAFTQPPLVYWLANRIDPRLIGLPFLYVYLLTLYVAMILTLIWAYLRRV